MKNTPTIKSISLAIARKLNTRSGILIIIGALIGMGFSIGVYYESVMSASEISKLDNKQTLEIIELRNKQTLEIIELQKKINLLEIQNEKGKKK